MSADSSMLEHCIKAPFKAVAAVFRGMCNGLGISPKTPALVKHRLDNGQIVHCAINDLVSAVFTGHPEILNTNNPNVGFFRREIEWLRKRSDECLASMYGLVRDSTSQAEFYSPYTKDSNGIILNRKTGRPVPPELLVLGRKWNLQHCVGAVRAITNIPKVSLAT